jgi:sugar phosphate isomerase/epimerase
MSTSIACCWFFPNITPEEGLPRLRAAGFPAIEIWSQDLRKWGVSRWKAALAAEGLGCVQLCPYLDVVHGATTVEMGRWVMDAMLTAAQELNCRRVRIFTGPPWGEHTVGPQQASEHQWADAAFALAEYADMAGPDVELCLECHEGSLMEDTPNTLKLIQAVNRPNLTVNLQLPFTGEEPLSSAIALAKYTTHIHIHAYEEGWSGPFTWLSSGKTDWLPVLKTLREHGAGDLCLSLEHPSHNRGHDAWDTVLRDAPWLSALATSAD